MRAYSPKTLGEQWGLSAETVRQMCKRGELTYFRPGPKMIRIPASEVERFECQNIVLSGTESNGALPTPDPLAGSESRLARLNAGGQRLSLVKSGVASPNPRRNG